MGQIRTPHAHTRTPAAGDRGFTLIEVQVTLVIMAIVAGMTVISVQNVLTAARGDTAMLQVASVMRMARDASIAQRRTIDLRFIEPNQVQLVRNDIPNGTTVIGNIQLENGARFQRGAAITGPEDGGTGPAVDFGDAETFRFQPDGMLTDEAGVPINGTVFTDVYGEPGSTRAVSITGSSGRAQCYSWNGKVWEEQ